jgi:putative ABC transport system permease protein
MSSYPDSRNPSWFSNNYYTYVLLRKGVTGSQFEKNFESLKKTYIEPQLRNVLGIDLKQFKAAGNKYHLYLQPLLNIHLYSHLQYEIEPNGNILYVYIFSGLALFILILACINFMNLATARSGRRAREVGIRKTLGSLRSQLSIQFFTESILLSLLSFLVAVIITEVSLPFFSHITGFQINLTALFRPAVLLTTLGIVLLTGIIAGSYPALMLSSFQPAHVLKGAISERFSHGLFRHILVVFQFTISIIIITGLLVINKQLNYIQQRSPGFNKEHVVIINNANGLGSNIKPFKQEMLSYPFIKNATATSFLPVYGYTTSDITFWPGKQAVSTENAVDMQTWYVDVDYVKTMGMKILHGRDFTKGMQTDSSAVILNQTAAAMFGFKNPIGKEVKDFSTNPDGSVNKKKMQFYKVIGIVKDFNYRSMHQKIGPLALFLGRDADASAIAFRIKEGSTTGALARLKASWKKYAPGQPFSYTFMNQRFDEFYRADMRVKDLMSAFSLLALFIACLGLLGLSAYSVERRTKEIGIRKVMGAGIGNIVQLISWEFMKLVVISFVIAAPMAWFIMHIWLRDFAYRTDIGVAVFVVAGVGSLFVALATVSWQAIRAALMDPVESLRNE